MAQQTQSAPTILRRKQVEARIGLSRSAIYAKLLPNPKSPASFDPTFPKPIRIGARSVGWLEDEIAAWLQQRIAASRRAAT